MRALLLRLDWGSRIQRDICAIVFTFSGHDTPQKDNYVFISIIGANGKDVDSPVEGCPGGCGFVIAVDIDLDYIDAGVSQYRFGGFHIRSRFYKGSGGMPKAVGTPSFHASGFASSSYRPVV